MFCIFSNWNRRRVINDHDEGKSYESGIQCPDNCGITSEGNSFA